MLKRKVKLMTLIVLTSIIYSSVNTYTAKAEGSRDMVKNGGYRPYTEWANNSTAGIVRKTLLKVYAKDGETINLGSSVSKNTTDILVRDPSGNSKGYDVTNAGKGYINSVDKETAGVKTSSNPNGYDPITIQVNQTGIWEVEFYGSDGPSAASSSGNKLLPVSGDFIANQANTVGAWDITVTNPEGTPIIGRVFTSYIALFMGANLSNSSKETLNSDFYVLTKDGYQYKTSMNGIDPNGFIFFSGNRGIIDKTNNLTLYHSAKYTNNELSSVVGNVAVQNPSAPDTETDVTHYVFFNRPSSDLPQNSMPTIAKMPITLTNLNFEGAAGLGNKSELKAGGIFTFNSTNNSSYKLIIHKYKSSEDITKNNWTFDPTVDKVIENTAVAGSNTVIWDGKDAAGNYCTDGNYSAKLMVKGGEYHFPVLDAEINPFGIKIELLNAPGSFPSGTNKNTVYYNESNYKTADGTTVDLNAPSYANSPIDASLGIDSSSGTHKYTTSYGDWKAIDTWTYFPGGATYLSFSIANTVTSKGMISGYVFNDMNADKAFNGEPGLKGITVSLKNSSGTVIETTTTDSTGLYAFNNIPQNSNYTVVVNAPASYTTSPNSCTTGNASQLVTLNTNSVIARNVGYQLKTDVEVNNAVSTAPYIKGHNIVYTLVAKNNGSIPATNVIVNDSLPAGLEYVSDTSSGHYDPNTGVWDIGTLSAGEAKTITITAKIKNELNLSSIITNRAEISCIEPETNSTNNKSSVNISAIKENSIPSVGSKNKIINEDGTLIDIITGTDGDGDLLTYTKASDPSNGTVTVNSDGSYTYIPNQNYNGSDSFTVTVSDGHGGTTTAIVNITVNPVNDAPIVSNLSKVGPEDTTITFTNLDFTNEFSDIDNDILDKVRIATLPTNGILKLNGDLVTVGQEVAAADLAELTFTPNLNWNGSTSFEWNGSDGTAYATLNGKVDITITPVNDAPVAVDDSETINEDTSIDINVLDNDSDIDEDKLIVESVTQGTHGTVTINEDGTIKYTPNENYNGPDSFTYIVSDGKGGIATATVNITVNAVNDAPIATGDSETINEDISIDIDVLANDSDIDGDKLIVESVTQGTHGTVAINPDGTVKYTPNGNYNGTDSFTYIVSDGKGGTATATVNVTVNSVNDAPIVSSISKTGDEDTTITFSSLDFISKFSDVDKDNLDKVKIATLPANGVLKLDGALVTIGQEIMVKNLSKLTFTPSLNWNGSISFEWNGSDGTTYSVLNGRVDINITPVNDAPIANNDTITTNEDTAININVLENDSDIDEDALKVTSVTQGTHGTATINEDGKVKYTPNTNYNGPDSFTYIISDGKGGTATATVNVTVNSVNDIPVVSNLSKTGLEDNDVLFSEEDFTNKFEDIDGDDLLKVRIVTLPSDGVLKLNGNLVKVDDEILVSDLSSLIFTPNSNWNGTTSFEWNGSDGTAYAALNGKVDITITPVNDAPIANNDIVTTNEDTPINIKVLENDSDIDEDAVKVTSVTQGTHGSVIINFDGTVKYTPNTNYNGVDSFTYTISDGKGGTATATVNLTINPVNDVPVVAGISKTGPEDTNITFSSLDFASKFSDVDGDNLAKVKIVTLPTNGVLKLNGSLINAGQEIVVSDLSKLIFTPNSNWNGSTSFEWNGSDGTVYAEVNGKVDINITPVNDTPTAPNYNRTTPYNTLVKGTVVGSDIDNDVLSYSLNSSPENGYVYLNTKGEWMYTPKTNFVGADSFKVEVSDGNGGTSISTITVTVKDKLTLEGTIVDKNTKKILPNTKVEIYDLKGKLIYSTITDSNGYYIISNVKMGLYEFKVGNSQYESQTVDIEVKPSNETEYLMRKDFELNQQKTYLLKLEANPVTIIGDGNSTATLIAKIIDSNNNPVANTKVVFSAEIGSFPNGSEAVTDENGIAKVIIKSTKIDGTASRRIPVTATVDDPAKNLHASDRIYITFEPGVIDGVVVDNETGRPIDGAVIEASKDFDGDGITDFYTKIITGADGRYSIAIPKGNMQYNITITKPVKVGNEIVQVKYNQNSYAGDVTGAGNESYSSVNTAAGIILIKDTDGDTAFLQDYSKFTLDVINKSDVSDVLSGIKTLETIKGINANLGDKGVFSAEGLEKGKDYTLAISYTLPDGEKIIVGTMNVNVGTDGQINLSSALIDPYGTITDAITNNIITGTHVKLYYADTARNRESGRIPNTLVNLPTIAGFDPADNENPQYGDLNGKYAYMVFPDTDYYLVVEKDGYETYISEIISVGKELVKKDIQMNTKLIPTETSTKGPEVIETSIERELPQTGSVIDLTSLGAIGLVILASGVGLTLKPKKKN